jgi:hypothetical protein
LHRGALHSKPGHQLNPGFAMIVRFAVLAPFALLTSLAVLAHRAAAHTPNFAVAGRIAVPGPVKWDYLTTEPGAHRLFVAEGDRIAVIDTARDQPIATIAPIDGARAQSRLCHGGPCWHRDHVQSAEFTYPENHQGWPRPGRHRV